MRDALFTNESRFSLDSNDRLVIVIMIMSQLNMSVGWVWTPNNWLIVHPYVAALGEHFIQMDDNARPHRDRLIEAFLNEEGIERIDWPAYSPDLNPSAHFWDYLVRQINRL